MYNPFDWLRRSRTGAELLAALQYLATYPDLHEGEIGPPHSALQGPCLRCWVHPRAPKASGYGRYCTTCELIMEEAWKIRSLARTCVVVWGYVNELPDQLRPGGKFRECTIFEPYTQGQNFLLMMYQRELRPWLQELVMYNCPNLKGFIQILPTTQQHEASMGDLLCRVIQYEAQYPMDILRIRFFSDIQQIFLPDTHEREGVLTFEVTEFLSALEMAIIFRTLLYPHEQEQVYRVLAMGTSNEEKFYWGRLLAELRPEARDMLQAWRLRQWSMPQINLLYELMRYVEFHQLSQA